MIADRVTSTLLTIVAVIVAAVVLLAVSALCSVAVAAPAPQIPTHSVQYRFQLEREVAARFGLTGDANVALVAAQLHAESAWQADAESAYAQGLGQFVPKTAAWLPTICPDIGEPDPWDAAWSIRAVACYDAWLFARNRGATLCDRWAFTFSDYNGGQKWRMEEQRTANRARADPLRWFGHVERFRARKLEAWNENRNYVRRILTVLAPLYVRAGWPGEVICT